MGIQAVFFDKDGTLIQDVPYNAEPRLMHLTPGVAPGLRLLHAACYRIIVVSNQSGVARGYFPESALVVVEERLSNLLAEIEVPLTGFYYCPHHSEGILAEYSFDCSCRKPQAAGRSYPPGARDHGIDLAGSWLVGDILDDIEAGCRAGCRTILIDNGNETEWVLSPERLPHHMVTDITQAAHIITCLNKYSSIDAHEGKVEARPFSIRRYEQ